MANYNQRLTSADDITVKTYYKNKNHVLGIPDGCNIIVTSIDNIAGENGTVTYKTCGDGEAAPAPKEAVKVIINFGGYSDTP